jgi:aspartyl protease family protein
MDRLANLDGGTIAWIVGVLVLLALWLPSLAGGYRGQWANALKHAAIWCTLLLAFVAAYAYRAEFAAISGRVKAELLPAGQGVAMPAPEGERAVRLRRSSRGPFFADAMVNGNSVSMLVDTGATSVVLRAADAERIGVDLATLKFTVAVDTANGSTFCAPLRLRSISVGGISYQNVEALVAQPGDLKESLLGMSFLKRLRSYEVTGDFLTLRS